MFENHFSPSFLPSFLHSSLTFAVLPPSLFVIVAKMVSKTDTEGERATANSFSGSPLRLAGCLAREGTPAHAKPFFLSRAEAHWDLGITFPAEILRFLTSPLED